MTAARPPFPLGQRLLARLQGFLERLRAEGVEVGAAAGVDLGGALRMLPVLDRDAFRTACLTTLAKSPTDLERVGRVFDEYWSPPGPSLPASPSADAVPRPLHERRTAHGPAPPRTGSTEDETVRETLQGRYSRHAPFLGHPLSVRPADELRRLRHACRRFRRTVATLPGRRWERAAGGAIDLRRTARLGLRTGGEWVELSRRTRAPRRADLVVLWDVSGSMREHSSSLFALVHSLCRAVPRSRVFAFGHDITEVSGLFRGRPYPRSLSELARHLVRTGGGTQIAHCLEEFRRHWGAIVRPACTVVILSDGWDLGEAPELARELERLRRGAGRVVWVNPYAADRGFSPDTLALRAALPFLDLLTSPNRFPLPYRTVSRGSPVPHSR